MEQVLVPEGQKGVWTVEKFTVSKEDESLERIRAFSNMGRWCPAGEYTRLMRDRVVMMSDTPDELADHWEPVWQAKGACLLNGLGLGVVLHNMAIKSEVDSVTVVEICQDVIDLVGPYYLAQPYGHKINIICANALEWKPPKGMRYDVVWHDIWAMICETNLPEMHRLHRRYGRRCDWQGSWCRYECERIRLHG